MNDIVHDKATQVLNVVKSVTELPIWQPVNQVTHIVRVDQVLLGSDVQCTIMDYTTARLIKYPDINYTKKHYTTLYLHYTTLHYIPLHSTPLHSTPLH